MYEIHANAKLIHSFIHAACSPQVLRAATQTTPVRSITHLATTPALHIPETPTPTRMSLMTSLMMMTRCLSSDTAKHSTPLMVRKQNEAENLSKGKPNP